jgi:hypothetical protein
MLVIPENIEIGKSFQEGLTCYLEGSVFEYNSKGCFLLIAYSLLTKRDIEAFYNGNVEFKIIIEDNILLFLKEIEGLRGWSASGYNYHLVDERLKPNLSDLDKEENLRVKMILIDANIGSVMGSRNSSLGLDLTKKFKSEIKKQSEKEFDTYDYYINLERIRRGIKYAKMI